MLLVVTSSTIVRTAEAAPTANIAVDGTTCTLADAITTANTDTATGGCTPDGSGADTLDLGGDITLTSALPSVESEITIEGNGNTIQRDASASNFRILDVTNDGNLTLNDVTITGGAATAAFQSGGGIRNGGTLTVNNSTISGNSARSGGGIFSADTFVDQNPVVLTINNSVITGNSATPVDGGGIEHGGDEMTITDSTIADNTAGQFGGGIDNFGENVTITGSTIASNTSGNRGGGIYNTGDLTIRNSTVSGNTSTGSFGGGIFNNVNLSLDSVTVVDNSATNGGALYLENGTATVKNSILANTTGGVADCEVASGTVTDGGNNLVESQVGCGLTAIGSDPNLGALADNGGSTQTHALLSGSPAIDAGDTDLATDQRGVARPLGTADDIGAFESGQLQDYGDAPASYGDAIHIIVPAIYLGAEAPDAETQSFNSPNADGDDLDNVDDEDSVASFPTMSTGTTSYRVDVDIDRTITLPATLYGWIDFNNDGVFAADEADVVPLSSTTVRSIVQVPLRWSNISVDPGAVQLYARFRITSDTLTDQGNTTVDERSIGLAVGGEVEDYAIPVVVPVTLASFDATVQSDGGVLVTWETATEIDHAGFNVYRSGTPAFDAAAVTQLNAALIAGQAGFGQGASYALADDAVPAGVWYYFLQDVALDGTTTLHGPVSADTSAPTSTGLVALDSSPTAAPMLLLAAATALAGVVLLMRRRQTLD